MPVCYRHPPREEERRHEPGHPVAPGGPGHTTATPPRSSPRTPTTPLGHAHTFFVRLTVAVSHALGPPPRSHAIRTLLSSTALHLVAVCIHRAVLTLFRPSHHASRHLFSPPLHWDGGGSICTPPSLFTHAPTLMAGMPALAPTLVVWHTTSDTGGAACPIIFGLCNSVGPRRFLALSSTHPDTL